MNSKPIVKQYGQAMTEFVVAAAFVMVPLFVIVPTVGKYIDMKLATVQAARYTTWEYTANYVDLKDQPGGFKAIKSSQLPLKSKLRVSQEAKRRFFSDSSVPISSTGDASGYDANESNPLWTFHNGLPMYDEGSGEILAISGSSKTPDVAGVSTIIGAVGNGSRQLGNLLQAVGLNVGFDAINPDGNFTIDGMYTAKLSIPVEDAPSYTAFKSANAKPLFGQELNLKMQAKSGILTESWSAGGKQHTLHQAGGLIPTILLSGIIQDFTDVASAILPVPSIHSSSLIFGYPVGNPDLMDQVPIGALKGESADVDCPGGYCER